MRLRYEVALDYEVAGEGSDFIFNVQAARTAQQTVVSESLALSQAVPMQEHSVGMSRLLRLRALRGPLHL
ncbi:MAG: transglutaminase family protein, partial [Burkholderiaceae bacterium]